jgi:hypothetical protein
MRKLFLKSLATFMVACMFVLTFGGFSANKTDVIHTEVIIEGVDCCQKEQMIIAALNGEEFMSTESILCIFGHSLAEGATITIEHRFWATSPRCRETVHRVVYCTRNNCNHMVFTQLSQSRLHCCS